MSNMNRRYFLGSIALSAMAPAPNPLPAPAQATPAKVIAGREIDFLDERWITHTYFLSRRLNQPVKLPEPVIRQNPASCEGTILPVQDGFAMWYMSPRHLNPSDNSDPPTDLRYAVTRDGYTFQTPSLHLREINGSTDNNVILAANEIDQYGRFLNGKSGCSSFCVLDATIQPVPHARGRYTALYRNRGTGMGLAWSDDGIHWMAWPEQPDYYGGDTYSNFFYDARISCYVMYMRPQIHAGPKLANRLVARIESRDMVHWENEQIVLDTDDRDASAVGTVDEIKLRDGTQYPRGRNRQFYGLTVTPWQDIYLGFATLYDVVPGLLWCELVHSYDGLHWIRETGREPLIPTGTGNDWDCGRIGYVAAGSPVNIGEDWYIYYTGVNYDHHGKFRGMEDKGRLRMIGAARIKRGRFVGYEAGELEGDLLTRMFQWEGATLSLNTDASKGNIDVEICDPQGIPINGYSRTESIPIREDSLRAEVQYRNTTLSALRGRLIRLRIHIKNGHIYGMGIH